MFRSILVGLVFSSSVALGAEGILLESVLARVGETTVRYSDVVRFRGIETLLQCSGVRVKTPGAKDQALRRSVGQYIEEELVYQEAKARNAESSQKTVDAIKKIKSFPVCGNRWKSLAERFGSLWKGTSGEEILTKELEKRLLVDSYIKEKIGLELRSWLQEAQARMPVKVYFD